MDIIGNALSHISKENRVSYLFTGKTAFPKHIDYHQQDRGTSNVDLTIFLLEQIADFCPVDVDDLYEFEQALLQNGCKITSSNFAVVVAVVCGLYTAYIEQDILFLFSLLGVVCVVYGVELEPTELLALTVFRLCQTGYFGFHTIEELFDHSVIPDSMMDYFVLLADNSLNKDFLIKPFEASLVAQNNEAEKLVAETLFYMCRIDSAYRFDKFKSLPREQLVEVYTTHKNPSNLAYLFGTVCMASEQLHCLIPKNLRENNIYSAKITEVLEYL